MPLSEQYIPLPGAWQGSGLFPVVSSPLGLKAPANNLESGTVLSRPVRIVRKKYASYVGTVPIPSMGRGVWFESTWERSFLEILRRAGPGIRVLEQPLTMTTGVFGLKDSVYTPDFLVWISQPGEGILAATLVEVKPEAVLTKGDPDLVLKLEAGERFALAQGWRFRLITDTHLWPSRRSGCGTRGFIPDPGPLASPSSVLSWLFKSNA